MKKFLTRLASLSLVAATLALAGCGTNNFITTNKIATIGEGEGAVQFENTGSFALRYDGGNSYHAIGEANVMNQQQADAFWQGVAQAGDNFVVLTIQFDAGSELVFGFVDDDANFDEPDGTDVKSYENTTEKDDTLDLILRVQEEGSKDFRVVRTKQGEEATTYTVDFTDLQLQTANDTQA